MDHAHNGLYQTTGGKQITKKQNSKRKPSQSANPYYIHSLTFDLSRMKILNQKGKHLIRTQSGDRETIHTK